MRLAAPGARAQWRYLATAWPSAPRLHLWTALLEEVLEPRFRFTIRLRNRRHQRLDRIAACRIHAGNARQCMHDGEIGERCIPRDSIGKFEPFGEALALIDEISR